MWRLACSVALRMASGTSRALPAPWPTRPLPSPTTTRAAKPKRRPPFTTLATRLMLTSFSTISPSSPRLRSPPRSRRSPLSLRAILRPLLEGQAALTGGVGQGFHPAMKQIRTTVEDHFLDPGGDGAFGQQLADRLGRVDVGAGLEAGLQRLVDGGGSRQRQALLFVDDLGRDVQARTEDRKPRTADLLHPDLMAHPLPAAKTRRFLGMGHGWRPTSSCLPCGRSFRPDTSRPCPYRAPAGDSRESPPPPGRHVACRNR